MVRTATLAKRGLFLGLLLSLSAGWALAARPKDPTVFLDLKEFFRPDLTISTSNAPLGDVLAQLPNRGPWEDYLASRGDDPRNPMSRVWIDPRSGAVTNLMGPFPLVPGAGDGNRLTLADLSRTLGRPVSNVDADVVAALVRRFASTHRAILGIDAAQLGPARATQVTPDLWQVSLPQMYQGVRVRDARLAASISHGNLVVLGTETWGDVRLPDATPAIPAEQAVDAGFAYAGGRAAEDVIVREPLLEIVPLAPQDPQDGEAYAGPIGRGYGHALVWTFVFQRPPEDALWEVMVDARSGEVIAFQDINRYVQKQVKGGVYPLTNTEICPDAARCGVMQSGWPMPFADTGLPFPNNFANSAGIFDWTSGTVTTTLTGPYVNINDNCGATSESSNVGDLDLGGVNGQHDCTSSGASPGDTAAARSGFYEVNKLAEQARGWLPTNPWLQSQITSNMNIVNTCNAFYSPSNGTINFYRSGGGCRNTGEIAAVFDHEWGHALDDNDSGGALSNSSEGYADIAAIYRLNASCVGYGFFSTLNDGCGQTADGTGFNTNEADVGPSHCDVDCSGVRDADWNRHADHAPDTALGFVCSSCGSGSGPCGRQVHCAAAPVRQAAWDLVKRDLMSPPFSLDSQTALIVGNKLFYQGSGNVGAWHACTCGVSSNGCGATNGYIQWLTADDDNGNLNDGTPHMTALFGAFDRHGIACATPAPQDRGCAGGPGAAPALTASAGNYAVALSWTSVAGATRYWVFRTEGHAGCEFGKTLIAEVTGTSYTDSQVANGRTYSYNVVAAGASSACYGPASSCVSATPTASNDPDFTLSCNPASLTVDQGGSGGSSCTVASQNGFSSAVTLDCTGLPNGAACAYDPNPVTPPPNGSAGSSLTVTVGGGVPVGTYTFQARGIGGGLTRTFNMTLEVTGPPIGDFTISAVPPSQTVKKGLSTSYTVTVTPSGGFNGVVTLGVTGLPNSATASFNPPFITGSGSSILTVATKKSTPKGTFTLTISGTSGSLTRTTTVTLIVTK
jgi:trimeric autotransporter adhesin